MRLFNEPERDWCGVHYPGPHAFDKLMDPDCPGDVLEGIAVVPAPAGCFQKRRLLPSNTSSLNLVPFSNTIGTQYSVADVYVWTPANRRFSLPARDYQPVDVLLQLH